MQNHIFVVDDNGHSHHKLAYMLNGQIKTLKIPSIIGDGASQITDTQGIPQDTYQVNGRRFCCNTQIQTQIDLRNEGYQISDENKALLGHAIVQAKLPKKPIILGVTLPWRQAYQGSGTPNTKRIEEVSKHYSNGSIINLTDNDQISFSRAKPYSEGLSAFFDWGIDDNGSLSAVHELQGPVAVADIGGSTTDIITVLGGRALNIDHSRSDTKKIGVLDAKSQVSALVAEKLQKETGVDPDADGGVPDWMLQQIINSGEIKLGSEAPIDVQEELDQIFQSVASQIVSYVKTTLGNPLSYQALVFAGGGAIVFKKYLSVLYPHAVFLDEFANARGALKFMMKIDRNTLLAGLYE